MTITAAQNEFLNNLLIDCQLFTPRAQRNGFLSERCKRTINHIDELSIDEASRIIKELLEKRIQERQARKSEDQGEMF